MEEISSHLCLGVPVCVCPPIPQRQMYSHTRTLQIILSCGCSANVKSEVSDWLFPPMRDVDSLVLSFLPTVDCSSESVPTKYSAKSWHNQKARSSNFWKIELSLYCQQEMQSLICRAGELDRWLEMQVLHAPRTRTDGRYGGMCSVLDCMSD